MLYSSDTNKFSCHFSFIFLQNKPSKKLNFIFSLFSIMKQKLFEFRIWVIIIRWLFPKANFKYNCYKIIFGLYILNDLSLLIKICS
jgi:hypothetical protein